MYREQAATKQKQMKEMVDVHCTSSLIEGKVKQKTLYMKDRFENINLEALPETLRFELETIREETKDFSDEEILQVWKKNFDYIYQTIEKKYPVAMKDYVPPPPSEEELKAKAKLEKYSQKYEQTQ
jgi:tRNA(Glu) U13 pseudouridine synthase TruD